MNRVFFLLGAISLLSAASAGGASEQPLSSAESGSSVSDKATTSDTDQEFSYDSATIEEYYNQITHPSSTFMLDHDNDPRTAAVGPEDLLGFEIDDGTGYDHNVFHSWNDTGTAMGPRGAQDDPAHAIGPGHLFEVYEYREARDGDEKIGTYYEYTADNDTGSIMPYWRAWWRC